MSAARALVALGLLGGLGALALVGLWDRPGPPPEDPPAEPEWAAPTASRRVAVGAPSALFHGARGLSERNNRAVAALEQGELDAAVEELEALFALAPEEVVFASNLAEALARRAVRDHGRADVDPLGALADLERASQLAPDRADLSALLERWRAAAEVEQNFAAYGSSHFQLSFDGERTDILLGAQRAVDVLERAYGDFALWFQADPAEGGRKRIRVVLTTREEFQRSTGLGHWAGGAFDGTLRLPVEDFEGERAGWSQVLRHELAHLFVQHLGGAQVPGWLNEGLAQWLEETRERDVQAARRSLVGEQLLGLEDLAAPLSRIQNPARIALAYRQSLAFSAYLVEQHGEALLLELVRAAGRGEPVEAAFAARVGFPLAEALGQFADGLSR